MNVDEQKKNVAFKLLRHVVFVQGRPILFSFHRKEAVENARYGDLNSDIPV